MATITDITNLKAKVETFQRNADRAAGALAQTMATLQKEFNCTTLQGAKALLEKLQKEEATAQKAFDTALAKFSEEWGDKLDVYATP